MGYNTDFLNDVRDGSNFLFTDKTYSCRNWVVSQMFENWDIWCLFGLLAASSNVNRSSLFFIKSPPDYNKEF